MREFDSSIQLALGDCLELMKSIPDGSIDMVLCDLPYGTTACKWDSVIPFEPLWAQYRRVVKKNAQKPVAICEYLIRTYTNEGELVLDNTMGCGTTGVACVNTGRRFVGIERDPEYFRIAEERIREEYQTLLSLI